MKAEDSALTIFNNALERPDAAARASYLSEACGSDVTLRERVEKLLQAHVEAGGFFSQPLKATVSVPSTGAAIPITMEKVGEVIGRYKLLEQIGQGGCGVVYMAEQHEPVRRRVALKIIKLGMDTKQVVARFEAERQALALMDHPNIAKVLEAGATDTGRPYFVMELVRGIKITEFCDQKKLSTQERLELFISVCRAVQHAHQKGIIHRDLKPSNILVTIVDGVPVPKVIDFGIAKATSNQPLTDKTLFTAFAQFIGTPAYMSPEQAEMSGVDIDTRTDIYSLGVVLYELLTGKTPFDAEALLRAGIDEIRSTIREQEPPKPSTRLHALSQADLTTTAQARHIDGHKLIQTLTGDLDWIVMKCLEKDRSRRFDTANGLAMDIQRHLSNEPVLACPPSTGYRLRKFVRKNRRLLFTGALLVALLVAATLGAIFAAIQSVRLAEKERELRGTAERKMEAETRAKEELERSLYLNRIARAQQELSAQNRGSAEQILDECPPDQRGWEWNYLRRSGPGNPLSIAGRYGAAALSSDGRFLALGNDNEIQIVDPATGSLRSVLKGHAGWIPNVAFCPIPGSPIVASANDDQTVGVWNAEAGEQIRLLRAHTNRVRAVAFSPDGEKLASGCFGGWVRIWNWRTGEVQATIRASRLGVSSLAYEPDGRQLAVGVWGNDEDIVILDARSGQKIRSFGKHDGGIESVAYAPGGRHLATCGDDGIIRVWNPATGELIQTLLGHTGQILNLAYSPDGRRLASAGWDKTVKLWNPTTAEEILTLRGHTELVGEVLFSRDGRSLVSAGFDCAKVWQAPPADDIADSGFLSLSGQTGMVLAVAFSPDGQRLASASADHTVKIWDLTSLGPAVTPRALTLTGHTARVCGVAFGPDGERLASASWDETVRIWDVMTGRELRNLNGHDTRTAVAFSPDGQRLAALGPGRLEIWDATSGQSISATPLSTGDVFGMAYSPNGRRLAYCIGAWVKIQDAQTGQETLALGGHKEFVSCVAYSLDGKRIASGCFDQTVQIWDPNDGKRGVTLRGHLDRVMGVAFSPDGNRLASASADSTVKLWDLETGREIATLRGHSGYVWCVAFSPDGKRLASGGGHHQKGDIRLWDLSRVKPEASTETKTP